MENEPKRPFEGTDLWASSQGSIWSARWQLRILLLQRPAAGIYVAPLLYAPVVLNGNRFPLALVAAILALAQVANGASLFFPAETGDERPRGVAAWQVVAVQAAGLAPWLLFLLGWSSLSTAGVDLILPALAMWGMVVLLVSGGAGTNVWTRAKTSDYRIPLVIVACMWGFALFILGLILVIKVSHPLR